MMAVEGTRYPPLVTEPDTLPNGTNLEDIEMEDTPSDMAKVIRIGYFPPPAANRFATGANQTILNTTVSSGGGSRFMPLIPTIPQSGPQRDITTAMDGTKFSPLVIEPDDSLPDIKMEDGPGISLDSVPAVNLLITAPTESKPLAKASEKAPNKKKKKKTDPLPTMAVRKLEVVGIGKSCGRDVRLAYKFGSDTMTVQAKFRSFAKKEKFPSHSPVPQNLFYDWNTEAAERKALDIIKARVGKWCGNLEFVPRPGFVRDFLRQQYNATGQVKILETFTIGVTNHQKPVLHPALPSHPQLPLPVPVQCPPSSPVQSSVATNQPGPLPSLKRKRADETIALYVMNVPDESEIPYLFTKEDQAKILAVENWGKDKLVHFETTEERDAALSRLPEYFTRQRDPASLKIGALHRQQDRSVPLVEIFKPQPSKKKPSQRGEAGNSGYNHGENREDDDEQEVFDSYGEFVLDMISNSPEDSQGNPQLPVSLDKLDAMAHLEVDEGLQEADDDFKEALREQRALQLKLITLSSMGLPQTDTPAAVEYYQLLEQLEKNGERIQEAARRVKVHAERAYRVREKELEAARQQAERFLCTLSDDWVRDGTELAGAAFHV